MCEFGLLLINFSRNRNQRPSLVPGTNELTDERLTPPHSGHREGGRAVEPGLVAPGSLDLRLCGRDHGGSLHRGRSREPRRDNDAELHRRISRFGLKR